MKKRVFDINGSVRRNSTNASILAWFDENFDEVVMEVFDQVDMFPHFNPDLDDSPPQTVLDFRKKIGDADGVKIVSQNMYLAFLDALRMPLNGAFRRRFFRRIR